MRTASKADRKRVEMAVATTGVTPYDGTEILAYINLGRWVADCACNGGELVAPGEQMLCGSCGAKNTVKFPDKKTRERIDKVLLQRDSYNQNWLPDETVAELVAQNIENGIYPEDM